MQCASRPALIMSHARHLHSRPSLSRAVLWSYLPTPVRYTIGLALQEGLVEYYSSLRQRGHESRSDGLLLLLEHTPVYTTGRRDLARQDEASQAREREIQAEAERLRLTGADYVRTQRGGQTTYHGPGQLVGYPILDTSLLAMSTREYVDALQRFQVGLLRSRGVRTIDSPHTGVFTSESAKIASIGIQIRHRISSHGFSINIEDRVRSRFAEIVACGLADVRATSVESQTGTALSVRDIVPQAVSTFGQTFNREMVQLSEQDHPELQELIYRHTNNG
ncbi:uncharacterized protein L969DRAFT_63820 [Mixia osmundae IAM 14324]|uniref:uncharacterized protein n=1 Tax=Mixia osmundae (strain CBS 9802 / IAM 14324 / JCM 22182 / KY 12970) TaxID=764103 RepID=UPI0004A54D6F|nr:uncharacterized protein L969DRAFT_63820 [Mixia osmundae IAM 14324]KEI38282.1 hypothetical protein L969DRAFT_63820 [Mixia osmundae IAM 14324]